MQHARRVIRGLAFIVREDGTLFPVLAGGFGGGARTPPPEVALQNRQRELLDMQMDAARRSRDLEPLLMEEAGIRWNPQTKRYEAADPQLQRNKREIERMQTERSLKALKGELPVSKTLQREFELGQQRLNEELSRQGGPGMAMSTAGIQKQEAFDRNRMALQEAEQRDMMTTAEALALQRGQSRSTSAQQFENPFAAQARMLIPAQQALDSARGQDNTTRGMRMQTQAQNGQETAGYVSGGIAIAGMAAMLI